MKWFTRKDEKIITPMNQGWMQYANIKLATALSHKFDFHLDDDCRCFWGSFFKDTFKKNILSPTLVVMILWHPTAAAILVKAPKLSGVLMFSRMTVRGIFSEFSMDDTLSSISFRSKIPAYLKWISINLVLFWKVTITNLWIQD